MPQNGDVGGLADIDGCRVGRGRSYVKLASVSKELGE